MLNYLTKTSLYYILVSFKERCVNLLIYIHSAIFNILMYSIMSIGALYY